MKIIEAGKRYGFDKVFDYVAKDPQKRGVQLVEWAENLSHGDFSPQIKIIREVFEDENHPYHSFVMKIFQEVDKKQIKKVAYNFFMNASVLGWQTQQKYREEYNCNIPWAILLDPTSACNLKCTGCWAAEYGYKQNLSYDEIDSIITQGKELGTYMYIYTGGEPLVRKDDLIKLCEKHNDCVFLSFTNATLIDEDFVDEMQRVGNFIPAISLEGFEEATDGRRGEGVYKKVIKAMKMLQERHLIYGISCCYTSQNFDSITSEEYYDYLIELGAYFVWYFHYMPVGNAAVTELLPTPEQRKQTIERLRKYRAEKPLFALDFQNDAEYVGGCIAGGRRYLHINASGDVEPCVFIHYSDSNIREKSLLDCLRAPLFTKYHDGQPFNDNMLMPCPMLENPNELREMVHSTDAKSTDLESKQTVDSLCGNCDEYAKNWEVEAEEIWDKSPKKERFKGSYHTMNRQETMKSK